MTLYSQAVTTLLDFRNLLEDQENSFKTLVPHNITIVFLNMKGDIDFLELVIMGIWETILF